MVYYSTSANDDAHQHQQQQRKTNSSSSTKSTAAKCQVLAMISVIAGLAILIFVGSDFAITTKSSTKNSGNYEKKRRSFKELFSSSSSTSSSSSSNSNKKEPKDLTQDYVLKDLLSASPSDGSSSSQTSPPDSSTNQKNEEGKETTTKETENNKNQNDNNNNNGGGKFPCDSLDSTRRPIENGTFGEDPGRRLPCMIGGDHAQFFNQGDNRYMYKSFIPRREVLETHHDDGQYCFVAWEVSNAVFNLQYENGWCCVYVPALHVPSKKFVGADIHFHDYLIRGVVNTKEFPNWRTRLIKDTEPIRKVWWKHFTSANGSIAIGKPGTKYIDDKIIEEAAELAADLIAGRKAIKKAAVEPTSPPPTSSPPVQATTPTPPPSTVSNNSVPIEHKMMDVLYDGEHSPTTATPTTTTTTESPKVEETDLLSEVPPSVVRPVPSQTPYTHLLITDLVGMMPAVSVAQLMSYWGHFYSAGIQAMGPEKVTVVINKKNWGGVGAKLIDLFARYLPVPALYLNNNVTYFAKRLTFAPRAYQDIIEPCAFHFLYNWMVPTVIDRFRAALKNGRQFDPQTKQEIGIDPGSKSHSDYTWSPHGNVVELEKGVFLRTPVPAEKERPWWPKEYDELIKNPPESLIILKTKTAAYSGRILEATPQFQKLAAENNFKFISDASPHDVRMFLINHAKRVITLWGGGGTIHSHLWGGGVKPRSEGVQLIDVILLIHPGYDWEFDGFYRTPLKSGGVDPMKTRMFTQGNLTTFLSPPNKYDSWSEAAFCFAYAWTKMIRIDDINKMKKEHMYISDEEKNRDLGPHCRDRMMEKVVGPRWKSKWEFKPPVK